MAATTIQTVLKQCGHAAVPLDDSYIHFQYAKRLAAGHFFSYTGTEGYSSGATSVLWPVVLAPFYAIGFRGRNIIWAAWLLSWLALFGLAVETFRLCHKLAGRGAAMGAAAMVIGFGGYAWFASSGMEVVPFAYLLAASTRHAAEWSELAPEHRLAGKRRWLAALAILTALMRPEGALAAGLVAITLLLFRSDAPGQTDGLLLRARWALLSGAGVVIPGLVNLVLTRHSVTSTTLVKWLPANPYYANSAELYTAITDHARLMVRTILDGREWSALFLPAGSRPYALLALAAIPAVGWLRSRLWRAGLVLLLALGIFIPCTYLTFLWNRLRYLWPFAFAWFIGVACLARVCADLLGMVRPRLRAAGGVLTGMAAGTLLARLGYCIDDVSVSAAAIDGQQVKLGHWVDENLPSTARVGVNDTGAIAYYGNRTTFDLVGLTTPSEAEYWVAGPGSRFEHYERLYRTEPNRLPTHFVVYPGWMACDAVLGRSLHEATVLHQTILGGPTMVVYEARRDLFGSGDLPDDPPSGTLVDELDVADLESERTHRYLLGATRETDNAALRLETDEGRSIAEGVRINRKLDRFEMRMRPGTSGAVFVGRWMAERPTRVEVLVYGAHAATIDLDDEGWIEEAVELPGLSSATPLEITVKSMDDRPFGAAHYWLYTPPQPQSDR